MLQSPFESRIPEPPQTPPDALTKGERRELHRGRAGVTELLWRLARVGVPVGVVGVIGAAVGIYLSRDTGAPSIAQATATPTVPVTVPGEMPPPPVEATPTAATGGSEAPLQPTTTATATSAPTEAAPPPPPSATSAGEGGAGEQQPSPTEAPQKLTLEMQMAERRKQIEALGIADWRKAQMMAAEFLPVIPANQDMVDYGGFQADGQQFGFTLDDIQKVRLLAEQGKAVTPIHQKGVSWGYLLPTKEGGFQAWDKSGPLDFVLRPDGWHVGPPGNPPALFEAGKFYNLVVDGRRVVIWGGQRPGAGGAYTEPFDVTMADYASFIRQLQAGGKLDPSFFVPETAADKSKTAGIKLVGGKEPPAFAQRLDPARPPIRPAPSVRQNFPYKTKPQGGGGWQGRA